MNFRAGQPSDAAALAAISIEVWLGTYVRKGVNALFADYALNEFTKPKMAAVLQGSNEHVVVSENDNGIDKHQRATVSAKPDSLSQKIGHQVAALATDAKKEAKRYRHSYLFICNRRRPAPAIVRLSNSKKSG